MTIAFEPSLGIDFVYLPHFYQSKPSRIRPRLLDVLVKAMSKPVPKGMALSIQHLAAI